MIAQGTVAAWPVPAGFAPAAHPVAFFDMPQKENNVHAAMFWGDVPFLQRADANKTVEWLMGLDFIAVAEIYNSTVVKYADIVVPSTSRFECSEDWKAIRISNGCVHLQQKVLDPMFEAKDDLEIERMILARWGYDKYLPETYEQLARHNLTKTSANIQGITFEDLVENDGMVPIPGFVHTASGIHAPKLNTHTGKAELYYESLIGEGLAFPKFEEPIEAYEGNPLKEKYPLIFIQGKSRFRMHSYLSSATWFWQMFEPMLMLHPSDAEERGLAEGDEVRVYNDRGEFVTVVTLDQTVRPGTAFMVEESFDHYYKSGLLQNVTNNHIQPRTYKMMHGGQVPYNDTLVEIEKA